MVDNLLLALGVKKLALLIAAFLGAMLSLKFVDATTWPARVSVVFGGTICASYIAPVASGLLVVSEHAERGLTFVIGLFGMTLSSQIFNGIRETKFGEILSGWLKRPGG